MSNDQAEEYTLKRLSEYNGEDESKPILLGINHNVYDVTPGAKFYGKGGSYSIFAGRDCTHNFAIGSVNKDDLPTAESDPVDLKTYSEDQQQAARNWEERLSQKYSVVGRLVKAE
ncbi:Dihydrodipicolinate synthase [Coemansia sp. RSA 2049]|nr:Dihydrodipicolinate synthase [Coemansia sp. RSA 1939]KAJ2519216.1 Dihydrodipicolinate synthase [Coemansia sp. RSA 2049]KAJ2593119.1 Dihydrodipicolinate synthase [Coemansia sp. RSA 1804]KAJ2691439.1 Dihydrodipicolinate synthase [Coemansia sp. RSA 1285]